MTWYLTIRRDAAYSESIAAGRAIGLLAEFPELRQSGPATFEGAPGMPWVWVVVAEAGLFGSYSIDNLAPSSASVVELACSYSEDATWYEDLAGRIAASLGWEAVEEHEGRRVWPPQGGPASL